VHDERGRGAYNNDRSVINLPGSESQVKLPCHAFVITVSTVAKKASGRTPAARPRVRRKEARPAELVAAALELFVERGYAATSVELVAQRAGVSKGTLFLYFASKEELFQAVVRANVSAPLREGHDEVRAWQGDTATLVPHLMQQWWSRYGDTPGAGITKLMMSEAQNFPAVAVFYQQEVVLPARELIRMTLQRGIDRGEFRSDLDVPYAIFSILAPLMFLILWRHSIGACVPADETIDPERYLQTQAAIVVQGLLKPAASRRSAAPKLRSR
jgi:TetR/AcrR family transcriptional regulator